jgi:ABC-type polar amino acid transport system ATPase subunit
MIDLSILLTWRDIARMKNSVNTNLLIFDEILDSSLDDDGIEEFLKIIWALTEGTNTFIISHRNGINEKFKETYRFSKQRNFTILKKEE